MLFRSKLCRIFVPYEYQTEIGKRKLEQVVQIKYLREIFDKKKLFWKLILNTCALSFPVGTGHCVDII